MIARMWRGRVRTEKAAEYVEIVEPTGMAGYRRTPGNVGAQLLTPRPGERLDGGHHPQPVVQHRDIKAFAGDDIDVAKYFPEDDEYLVDRDATVAHFQVAPPR